MTLLTFKSKQFDIANEPRNDINPIFGQSLAEMLRQEFTKLGHETFLKLKQKTGVGILTQLLMGKSIWSAP